MRATKVAQQLLPSLTSRLRSETSTFVSTDAEAVYMGIQNAKTFSEYGKHLLVTRDSVGSSSSSLLDVKNSLKGAFDMFSLCCERSATLAAADQPSACLPPGAYGGLPVNVVALSHIHFALFCDDCLRRHSERKHSDGGGGSSSGSSTSSSQPCEWDGSITADGLAGMITRHLLNGMRILAGPSSSSQALSEGANDRFPRLLSLLSTFCSASSYDQVGQWQLAHAAASSSSSSDPPSRDGKARRHKEEAAAAAPPPPPSRGALTMVEQEFLSGCLDANMPSWLFLRWTNQLTAALSRPEGAVLVRVLERMAETYSRALYYPLNLSLHSLPVLERGGVSAKIGRLRARVQEP